MDTQATEGLLRFFRSIQDPRAANARHALDDLLTVAILAVLCGAEGWAAVEAWGRGNIQWLSAFLELPHGIPSHDTFDRVFGLLDPAAFEKCFTQWTANLVNNAKGLFIAVDGKTLRRSFKRAWSKTPVHLVSAFASRNQVVLGQIATDCKSNEITAIPKLLAMLNLTGATVTIDAMGCQREIAAQIRQQQGHYVLSLKDNQPTLREVVEAAMNHLMLDHAKSVPGTRVGFCQQTEQVNNHGRVETRRVWVSDQVKCLGEELLGQWPGLSSMALVESVRQDLGDCSGKITTERRLFISSHEGINAQFMADAVRSHWGVENSLHWQLDVSMNEDQCRLRMNHGAENFSRLRRIALNKLKRWQIKKENGKVMQAGIRLKQQACGWSREFLIQALLA
jgi:predicted transposase YbfD/YdcC